MEPERLEAWDEAGSGYSLTGGLKWSCPGARRSGLAGNGRVPRRDRVGVCRRAFLPREGLLAMVAVSAESRARL